eukprot:Gb_08890 [translate_table: standard]
MIRGYAMNEPYEEALALYYQMQQTKDTTQQFYVFFCTQGMSWSVSSRRRRDVVACSAMIAVPLYVKCGSVKIACHMFDKMYERNLFTWSAMIVGHGMNGYGKDALELLGQMLQTGMKPNDINFIGVLYACSRAGLLNGDWQYFDCMRTDYGITPSDMYVWLTFLVVLGIWTRIHCNTELGEHVAERHFELQPENTGFYVLLSNIYAAAGRWDDVERVRAMMRDKGLTNPPGRSLIEVDNRIHAFIARDKSHPQSGKIYAMLQNLTGHMKDVGYVPDINFVLRDAEGEVKEHMPCSHSEKLAIAFGLIYLHHKESSCMW